MMPPADGATAVTPGAVRPDATSMMPPADLPDAGRAEAAARAAAGRGELPDPTWSARAQVRPPRPGQGGDFTPTEWVPAEREPRGAWWMPIVIGVVVLLLVGLLGFGVWLIVQGVGDDEEAPAPAVTTSAAPAKTRATSAARTTTTTRQTTTAPAPEDVEIPALVGLSAAEAGQALDRVDLTYRLIYRTSRTAPPGTVIDSDPQAGQEVPADTEVTLVIAAPVSPTTGSTSTAPTNDADLPDEE
jgi:cytoskeletal protein RodZ